MLQLEGVDRRIVPIQHCHGDKATFDTVSCAHCQAIIKVFVAGIDDAEATRFRCSRCDATVCRKCNESGFCSPIKARIEESIKQGRWVEQFEYHYRNCIS